MHAAVCHLRQNLHKSHWLDVFHGEVPNPVVINDAKQLHVPAGLESKSSHGRCTHQQQYSAQFLFIAMAAG